MATAIVAPTASQLAHAEQLLASPEKWSHGRSKVSGEHFWLIQGSNGTAHWTTARGCTCRGYRFRGCCAHVVAVTMREAQAAARLPELVCPARDCAEPVEVTGLCRWHAERKARLARELGVA